MSKPVPILMPPPWVIVLGSLAIGIHLFMMLVSAVDVPSGPWVSPLGSSPAEPPRFAYNAVEHLMLPGTRIPFNRGLPIYSSFHFESNRQETQEIAFEVTLKDATGKVLGKRTFPDPEANLWVRHRQSLLARRLGNDEPLPPQQGVVLAPAGQKLELVQWWHPETERKLVFKEDSPNAVPRNQPVMRPARLSHVTARSYARYLCRANQAERIDLIRYWYDPIYPTLLFGNELPPAESLSKYQASYGDLTK